MDKDNNFLYIERRIVDYTIKTYLPDIMDKLNDGKEIEFYSQIHIDVLLNVVSAHVNIFYKEKGVPICRFSLATLPGCCGSIISYHTYVDYSSRNKGIGKILQKIKEDIAVIHGFSSILCTTTSDNKIQQNILRKNKWNLLSDFLNERTGNIVQYWAKSIGEIK